MPSLSMVRTTRRTRPGRALREPAARVRTATIPMGLLGMLGLVAVVELFVARHPLDFSDPVSLSWELSAQGARSEAPGSAILAVGDSLVKHGVIPAVVEARTGLRTCNLGV